jgi:CubicO group peptidase (beta-lactamase class C family)
MKIFSLLIAFTLISTTANGQISNRIDSLALEHEAKGFNGNILYSKNDSTIFDLASLSKQFTAVAIVQLVEKEKLTYNTKVNEIIKGFPYSNITVEHLLRHQSGLPGYQGILSKRENWDREKKATNKDLLKVLSDLDKDLEFQSGSKYKYSNTGYAILGSIIEQLSGQSYKNYIQENILTPAGMSDIRVQSKDKYIPDSQNIARGYTYQNRLFGKNRYEKVENDKNHKKIHWMNNIVGARGIYSSILDMEKWKKAIRYNKLISERSKQKMFSPDTISKKYGYGFAIYNTESKGKWVYHNGSWSGYKTMALYLPDSNEYLVILSNNRYEETHWEFEKDFYELIQ